MAAYPRRTEHTGHSTMSDPYRVRRNALRFSALRSRGNVGRKSAAHFAELCKGRTSLNGQCARCGEDMPPLAECAALFRPRLALAHLSERRRRVPGWGGPG